MDTERTRRTTNPRLLRLVEVLPGPGSGTKPGLHLNGDKNIGDAGHQIDLIVPDPNVATKNGGASPL